MTEVKTGTRRMMPKRVFALIGKDADGKFISFEVISDEKEFFKRMGEDEFSSKYEVRIIETDDLRV